MLAVWFWLAEFVFVPLYFEIMAGNINKIIISLFLYRFFGMFISTIPTKHSILEFFCIWQQVIENIDIIRFNVQNAKFFFRQIDLE